MPKKDSQMEPAVIYGRYSSHNQKDVSIEQQVAECRAYAKANNLRVIHVYADRAISGKTDRRPEFQQMMRDAEKGKFKYVLAWKSNRIGRNMLQSMINESRLNDWGIRCLYTEEDFDDTAAGRFALRSMMNVNQFYSENMAEDIKRGMNDNARNCMVTNGQLPYGYKASQDLRYEIDEPRAVVVREIYQRVANGDAFVDIANDLNARGIMTARKQPWGRSSFQRLLSNERYRGVYIYDNIRVEGGIPRIVSDEIFYKVQEVLKVKRNPRGRHRVNGDYLLTGKLYCGKCKSPMTGISGTGKSGQMHYYYICQRRRTEKACDKKNVRRDEIELAVARAIRGHVLQDDVIAWIADSTLAYNQRHEEESRAAVFEDELAEVKRSIKNLLSAIEQGIITSTTKERLMELEAEQADISAKLAAARADIVTITREDLIAGLEAFRDGDVQDKKYQAKLFDMFLVAVYVYDDHLKIVFSFSGDKNTIAVPLESPLVDSIGENLGGECSFRFCTGSPMLPISEPAFYGVVFVVMWESRLV